MEILYSALIGYTLGNLSPAALVAKLKNVNLRAEGSQNLGGTNTMLVIGRAWGITVMLLDIFKGFLASRLARWLFPQLRCAMLIAGLATVVGHIFPITMGFRGGKGLASFGGMVLAYSPWMFLLLGVIAIALMLLTNVSVVAPLSAAVLFPVLVGLRSHDLVAVLLCAAASGLIIVKHWSNIEKARSGKEISVRSFFKNGLKQK